MKKPVKLEVGKKYLTRNGCIAECVLVEGYTAQCAVKTKYRKWAGAVTKGHHYTGIFQKQIGGWYYSVGGEFGGGDRKFPLTIVKELK